MQGFVCDRCGAAIFPDEHSRLECSLTGPDDQQVATTSILDICPKCAQAISGIIRKRLITTETREGAWFDSEQKPASAASRGRTSDEGRGSDE